jgi:prepilin-type processing-associated H-X9-DG protein
MAHLVRTNSQFLDLFDSRNVCLSDPEFNPPSGDLAAFEIMPEMDGCPNSAVSTDLVEVKDIPSYHRATTGGRDDDGVSEMPETYMRLREGIERFLITDINNPAASALAQTEVVLMLDAWAPSGVSFYDDGVARFNHVPGGVNVLYMDGHVEFVKYGEKFPCDRSDKYGPESLASYMDFYWAIAGGFG